jgi:hypothetical protein
LVFNLSTLMQAAARSYRLNQTHEHCKVIYLYAEGTMEQTAVQLMSRKQRAAKLLTGDIGLTGLDALTEGEGGFEQALLDAIGRDDALLDPSELFKASGLTSDIDAEDAAYWNVEDAAPQPDPILMTALELGATVTLEIETPDESRLPPMTLADYLDSVSLIGDVNRWAKLKREAIALVEAGKSPTDLCAWLTENKAVFPGCEGEVAAKLVEWMPTKAPDAPLLHIEARRPVVLEAKPKRKPQSKIVAFPQTETLRDDAPVKQLALF